LALLPAAISAAAAIASVTVPASATSAAATSAAPSPAATATTEAAAAATASTTTASFTGRPRLIDDNVAAHKIVAVESLDGALGFFVAIYLDKSEPAWLP
jgi:hypothetical protein